MNVRTAITSSCGSTSADPAEVFRARVEARALLYAHGEIALDEVCPLNDEYAGLTHSFAHVCREADQTAGKTKQVKPFCPALSTIQAAEWLIRQNNAARFHSWLASHSARERAGILEHINEKRGTP